MRFRDFDGQARITLAGSAAAVAAFLLPWVGLRLNLQVLELNGTELVAAPLVLQRIGTPVGPLEGYAVAGAALVALLAALANFFVILAPGLSTLRDLNPRAGRGLALVGLAGTLLALLLMATTVGPQVGVTTVTYGGVLAVAGLAVAAYAWPKARRLGDDEAPHADPPPPPPPAW